MTIRTMIFAVLAFALGASAQNPPGPGRGRMGRFGPEMAGVPPGPRVIGAFAGRPRQIVKNAPYSADAITESTQVLADGNRIRQTSTAKVYRDAEGRVRQEQSLAGLGPLAPANATRQVIFINDPVAHLNYALNPADKTGSRTALSMRGPQPPDRGRPMSAGRGDGPKGLPPEGRRGGWTGQAAVPNMKTESLGRQTIEGVAAEGTRTIQVFPAGQMGNEQPIQIVSERWYSPDLQTVVLSKHSDPRFGETVFRLTNISRAAPAAALFQPPADYKITDGVR